MNWVWWSLLSAVFASVTAVLAKAGVRGMDPNFATAVRTTVVVVLSWTLVAALRSESPGPGVSRSAWMFLIASGLATGASWLCYFQALAVGPVSRVAPVDKLSVALTVLLGAMLFGEAVTLQAALGTLLVIAGAVLIATA